MQSVTRFDIFADANPTFRISNLINELNYVKSTLEESVTEEIVRRLCEDGSNYASMLNSVAPQSGTEKSVVDNEIDGNHGEIRLSGPNAVYDEFGTGEEGALNSHPMKNMFDLNPYNSGPFVSTHVDRYGQHFWFYSPMKGQPFFRNDGLTYGIPSGKQMYNTLLHIREIKDKVVSDEINKATKTLK